MSWWSADIVMYGTFNTCWQTEQSWISYGCIIIAKSNLTMVITSKHKQLPIHSQQSTVASAQRHCPDDNAWNWTFQKNWFGWSKTFPHVDTAIIIIIIIIIIISSSTISLLLLQATDSQLQQTDIILHYTYDICQFTFTTIPTIDIIWAAIIA